jgi:hypothetical protein
MCDDALMCGYLESWYLNALFFSPVSFTDLRYYNECETLHLLFSLTVTLTRLRLGLSWAASKVLTSHSRRGLGIGSL